MSGIWEKEFWPGRLVKAVLCGLLVFFSPEWARELAGCGKLGDKNKKG